MELLKFLRAMLPLPIDMTGIFNLLVLMIGCILWHKINKTYKVTHSRQLLNSVPNIFTSLGILFTFVSICISLSDVSSGEVVKEADRIGKTVGELNGNGDIDLPTIVKNLIPAFTTSIWGIIMAMYSNYKSRKLFAEEDAKYDQEHATPEKNIESLVLQLQDFKISFSSKLDVLDRMYKHMKEQDENTKQYNEQLNSNIKEQSSILEKFINDFVARMDDIFTRMHGAVEQQIMTFGQAQFSRTNDIMQKLADEMSSMSKSLVDKQSESVNKMMADTNAQIATITNKLTALTNNIADQNSSALEALSTRQNEKLDAIISSYNQLSQDSLTSFKEMGEEMKKLGSTLAEQNNTALSELNQLQTEKLNSIIAGYTELNKNSLESYQQMTSQMSSMAKTFVDQQNASVNQMMTETNTQMAAVTDRLTSLTKNLAEQNSSALEVLTTQQNQKLNSIIEGYTNLNKSSLESYQQMATQMKEMNVNTADEIRNALTASVKDITCAVSMQCNTLGEAITKNVVKLEHSYSFIDKYVAQLKADYEQATLAYTDAVQNAHDLNASFEDTIKQVDRSLKSVVTTNETLDKIMKTLNERQTNIESLIMKIKEVGATIETLQKLESTLNKIVNR